MCERDSSLHPCFSLSQQVASQCGLCHDCQLPWKLYVYACVLCVSATIRAGLINITIIHDFDFNHISHYEVKHYMQLEELNIRMLVKSRYQADLPCLWKQLLLLLV